MTSLQLIRASISGGPVDRVANMPLVKEFCARQTGANATKYHRDHRVLVDCQIQTLQRWPFDCFNVIGYPYREAGDCGLPLSWPENGAPKASDVLVRQREDIGKITWAEPEKGPLMRDRLDAIRAFKMQRPDVAVLGWVEGCFAQAVTFLGMDKAMMALVDNPTMLHELMEAILPLEIAFAKAQIQAGADIIGVGDAAASLVGRHQYVDSVLPYERRLIDAIHETNIPIKLHICGNISHLIAEIAQLKVEMVDIDAMVDLRTAREILGPKVCLCGNFNPVSVLLQSTPEAVRRACQSCIKEAGPPFVLSAGCEVPPETPPENFAAMCENYSF